MVMLFLVHLFTHVRLLIMELQTNLNIHLSIFQKYSEVDVNTSHLTTTQNSNVRLQLMELYSLETRLHH